MGHDHSAHRSICNLQFTNYSICQFSFWLHFFSPPLSAADLDALENSRPSPRRSIASPRPSCASRRSAAWSASSGVLFGTGPTTGLVVDPRRLHPFQRLQLPQQAGVDPGPPARTGPGKPAKLVATDHNRMIVLLKIDPPKPLPVPRIGARERDPRRPVGDRRGPDLRGQPAEHGGRHRQRGQPHLGQGHPDRRRRLAQQLRRPAGRSPRPRARASSCPSRPKPRRTVAGVEWYDSGIGFAVPAEHLQRSCPRLKKGEDLQPGVAGLSLGGESRRRRGRDQRLPAEIARRRSGIKRETRLSKSTAGKSPAPEVKEQIARRYASDTPEFHHLPRCRPAGKIRHSPHPRNRRRRYDPWEIRSPFAVEQVVGDHGFPLFP